MKSLALRALALLLFGWMAHSIKPFTSENLVGYAVTTAQSLATWLPETAAGRWEKTAALAALLKTAWSDESNQTIGLQPRLAARLPVSQPTTAFKQKSRKASPAKLMREELASEGKASEWKASEIEEAEDFAEVEETTLAETEETLRRLIRRAAGTELPLPVVETERAFGATAAHSPRAKRAACEIPATVGTSGAVATPEPPAREMESETAPASEPETQVQPVLRLKRQHALLIIEIEPVRYRLTTPQALGRSLFNRQNATASKC